MDIVVTSVPTPVEAFLDIAWLSPGSFVAFVDIATPWHTAGISTLDLIVVDDRKSAEALSESGRLKYPGPFPLELDQLVAGNASGRCLSEQRTGFIPVGIPLGDLAIAQSLLSRITGRVQRHD